MWRRRLRLPKELKHSSPSSPTATSFPPNQAVGLRQDVTCLYREKSTHNSFVTPDNCFFKDFKVIGEAPVDDL